jgi:hypothetical protein
MGLAQFLGRLFFPHLKSHLPIHGPGLASDPLSPRGGQRIVTPWPRPEAPESLYSPFLVFVFPFN